MIENLTTEKILFIAAVIKLMAEIANLVTATTKVLKI